MRGRRRREQRGVDWDDVVDFLLITMFAAAFASLLLISGVIIAYLHFFR